MKALLACVTAAALLCAGCAKTAKQEATTETTTTTPDGREVKTETTVEKKTTVNE